MRFLIVCLCTALASFNPEPTATATASEQGFKQLFDGKTFGGWKAIDMTHWSIEDGAITGRITKDKPLKDNLYLVWQGGDLDDFELKLKHRVFGSDGINCGFQFRSKLLPNHDVAGYQVDNNLNTDWLVRLYDEHGRHTLAMRGERTVFDHRGRKATGPLRDAGKPATFRLDQWHEYHLVCRGPRLTLFVDGKLVAEVIDDASERDPSGILALQLHTGPPTTAQFKDIRLEKLTPAKLYKSPPPRLVAPDIRDKTLVAWVALDKLDQRGGSVLTLENATGEFDGLVYGELSPKKWMAGSEFFRRTERNQAKWPEETAKPGEQFQIATVYRGQDVRIYRNGVEIAQHQVKEPKTFGADRTAVIGLRHIDAGDRACLSGSIDDARIYDRALDPKELAELSPNEKSGPRPLAWWDFEDGSRADRMNHFSSAGELVGDAKIANARLVLAGHSYFVADKNPRHSRASEQWPTWHVTALPEEGVCLPYDANGCIYWKGRYHLMYIYQDPKRPHGGHCWGHASSADLVNWTFHPPAIVPERGDPDVGIFSGNAFINKDGKPMLCWFGINAGVCVATAEDDELIRWKKHPKNPIVPIPKPGQPGHGKYTVWDPYLWLEKDTYYCLLGGNQLPNKKDTLYLCRSTDLETWQPLHSFYEHPDLSWTTDGEDCSCPDFFPLGDKHALMCISHKVGARLYLGRFDREKEKFLPERHVRMNWPGGNFFAPESLQAPDGRRIFWAWVTDPRDMRTQRATGSGYQSMPRVLSLSPEGKVRITPAKELEALRDARQTIAAAEIPEDGEITIENVAGDSLELRIDIEPGAAKEVGVKVRCTPDGSEQTAIAYDVANKKLILDMSRSTTRTDVAYSNGPLDRYGGGKNTRATVEAPLELAPGEALRLRIFLDKSLLEVFANDRQCITQQIYPEQSNTTQIRAYATSGPAKITSGDFWRMKPATFTKP